MARIVLSACMFRYPLGGMLSWALQYLLGLKALGHEVYFVEKYGCPDACYDPSKGVMSNDPAYGLKIVSDLLTRFELAGHWCFVGYGEEYHGLSKKAVEEVFRTADLFIDLEAPGGWAEEATHSRLRVLIDGEPAYTQMKWANDAAWGRPVPVYDRYYTNGKNVGTAGNPVPTLGIRWEHVYSPVVTDLFRNPPGVSNGQYSTVMNWRSHAPLAYKDKTYGQKAEEFQKFVGLPRLVKAAMAIAVSGKEVPVATLQENGWSVVNGEQVSGSFDAFRQYVGACRGEFSVCKNVFVVPFTGWFSDKSAAYLASGRPVVLQDTGFSRHLPTGQGLLAVNNAEEAREAIGRIEDDYALHSRRAREIAHEYLEAKKVMHIFLNELGL